MIRPFTTLEVHVAVHRRRRGRAPDLALLVDAEGEVIHFEEADGELDVGGARGGNNDGDFLHHGNTVSVQTQGSLHIVVSARVSPLNIGYTTTVVQYTGFAFRFEHRKWNRGRNRLPKLVQTIAPSVPFPVFTSEGEPGTVPLNIWNLIQTQFHI